jgi:thioesterase domain-containing protein
MTDEFQLRRLQDLVHEHIPMARAMQARVVALDSRGLHLEAPLEPNANHHGTFFGGGAAALGVLAGWGMAHLKALEAGLDADVIIQRTAVRYLTPAPGALRAVALEPGAEAVGRAVTGYRRHGLSRLRVTVELECAGTVVARLESAYGWVGEVPEGVDDP